MNSNKGWDIFAQPLCEYSMIDMKMPEIAGWKMSSKILILNRSREI